MVIKGISQEQLQELRKVQCHIEGLDGKIVSVKAITNGRINKTYNVMIGFESVGFRSYIFRGINPNVFKKPEVMMSNIDIVTKHIRKNGGITLCFHPVKGEQTCDSSWIYFDQDTGSYWTVYEFIDSTVKNQPDSPDDFISLGRAIGTFATQLSNLPKVEFDKLEETIPNFHNTPVRYETFEQMCRTDCYDRVKMCQAEVTFLRERKSKAGLITRALECGEIPQRVSHNDTKLNNVLFDKNTGKELTLIDLDTTMPGSLLYDIGDAARYACNSESEESEMFEDVWFNRFYFEKLVRGLSETMRDAITEKEIEMLVDGVWVITYEQALRFLSDYLDGDKYFGNVIFDRDGNKHIREVKNLERAIIQIELLRSIEAQYEALKEIVTNIFVTI